MSIFGASNTVVVAQLVRALDCGSRGRGFEPHHPPETVPKLGAVFFILIKIYLFQVIFVHR